MSRKVLAIAAAVFIATAVSACGGSDTTIKQAPSTTTGQQLIDLQKALESGAISKKEYDQQKKKILNAD